MHSHREGQGMREHACRESSANTRVAKNTEEKGPPLLGKGVARGSTCYTALNNETHEGGGTCTLHPSS